MDQSSSWLCGGSCWSGRSAFLPSSVASPFPSLHRWTVSPSAFALGLLLPGLDHLPWLVGENTAKRQIPCELPPSLASSIWFWTRLIWQTLFQWLLFEQVPQVLKQMDLSCRLSDKSRHAPKPLWKLHTYLLGTLGGPRRMGSCHQEAAVNILAKSRLNPSQCSSYRRVMRTVSTNHRLGREPPLRITEVPPKVS